MPGRDGPPVAGAAAGCPRPGGTRTRIVLRAVLGRAHRLRRGRRRRALRARRDGGPRGAAGHPARRRPCPRPRAYRRQAAGPRPAGRRPSRRCCSGDQPVGGLGLLDRQPGPAGLGAGRGRRRPRHHLDGGPVGPATHAAAELARRAHGVRHASSPLVPTPPPGCPSRLTLTWPGGRARVDAGRVDGAAASRPIRTDQLTRPGRRRPSPAVEPRLRRGPARRCRSASASSG